MLVTADTRQLLTYRRFDRRMRENGFVEISENGDPLWKFHRGAWHHERIAEAAVHPDGHRVFIKLEPRKD